MADDKPLTDNQAGDRLWEALQVLGKAPGVTVRANTALEAARRVLSGMQLALLLASERNQDDVRGVRPLPEPSLPKQPD